MNDKPHNYTTLPAKMILSVVKKYCILVVSVHVRLQQELRRIIENIDMHLTISHDSGRYLFGKHSSGAARNSSPDSVLQSSGIPNIRSRSCELPAENWTLYLTVLVKSRTATTGRWPNGSGEKSRTQSSYSVVVKYRKPLSDVFRNEKRTVVSLVLDNCS